MATQITKTIIVQGTAEDLYRTWAQFEAFPSFMKNIQSVKKIGNHSTRWVMVGPGAKALVWQAETTLEEDNKRIAWNSKEGNGQAFKSSGQVTFNTLPNDQTELTLVFQLTPPADYPSKMARRLRADLDQKWTENLRGFKAHMEQG